MLAVFSFLSQRCVASEDSALHSGKQIRENVQLFQVLLTELRIGRDVPMKV